MYKQIASNKRRTWVIMILFIALLMGMGYLFGYSQSGDEEAAIGSMGIVTVATDHVTIVALHRTLRTVMYTGRTHAMGGRLGQVCGYVG